MMKTGFFITDSLVYSCRVELKSKEIVFNEEIPDYPVNQMLRMVFKLLRTPSRPPVDESSEMISRTNLSLKLDKVIQVVSLVSFWVLVVCHCYHVSNGPSGECVRNFSKLRRPLFFKTLFFLTLALKNAKPILTKWESGHQKRGNFIYLDNL